MTAMLSSEAKERVREAVDLVALVGEKVALRRAGRSWKGLCPFHAERTPSFTVNPDRQVWHCFGCGKGGDLFAWVTETEKVAFPEALRMLAERAGIELPKTARGPGDVARDRLYQANALANDYFRASLDSEAGAEAREYMTGRGFDRASLDAFQIGWAPAGWDGLVTTLGKLVPVAVLEEAGLALRRADGSRYDRFRNRITFPVMESAQRTAGFGARAIALADQPKYLNSPETAVYRKGSILFGLPQARAAIRDTRQALIAEGYLDVMRLHAAGFRNAVATSGTALTYDQARILARLEAEAVLVYDGDDAGVRAADRALEPLMRAGLAVRVLLLPPGEDPDTFIRKEGPSAFQALLADAADAAGFLAGASLGAGGENPSVEARVRRYVEVIGRSEDPIRRRMLVRRGAEAFALEEKVLLEALERKGGRAPKKPAAPAPAPDPGAKAGMASAEPPEAGAPAAGPGEPGWIAPDPVESELAALVLTEEGALGEVVAKGGADCFRHQGLRDLLDAWLAEVRVPGELELLDLMNASGLARAVLTGHPKPEEPLTDSESRRGARALIERLEERRIRASIQDLDRAIRQAERSHDAKDLGLLGSLVAERRDLASKLHSRSHPAVS
ncbi:MAG TPA: DNA primase [Candidatus Eisenbacteria bacterium]|nr:DNA primase [Candidatus Eisenbacteria bacterium]